MYASLSCLGEGPCLLAFTIGILPPCMHIILCYHVGFLSLSVSAVDVYLPCLIGYVVDIVVLYEMQKTTLPLLLPATDMLLTC